ncbi:MAG: MFS transporter [Lewinellaceae bacterium]|nr:oligopeptide:H+ symporter [Saprospiraceae bacterium]MCB9340233.1 MFS transporter [Lewinellaceae bacterium]
MDAAIGLLIFGWLFVLIWVPLVVLSQRKVHPKALFTLFFTEMWERFSFYGMRAFLVLYMTGVLFKQMAQGEADERAYGIYGAFNALLYAAPVIGGMVADKILGFRRTILLGGVCMASAQFILAANAFIWSNEIVFFIGLGLLAVGNGFFKPNISSFLGTFYDKNDSRKDGAFTIFYMGINIGAFLAPITCAYLAQEVDWSLGFLAAGIGMVLGLTVFWNNMSKYEDKGNPPNPASLKETFFAGMSKQSIIILISLVSVPLFALLIDFEKLTDLIMIFGGLGVLGYIVYGALTMENREDGQRLLVFFFLFFFHMIFWMLFEQAGGSLTILADRYVNKEGLTAGQLQAVNPLFIMLLAPVFSWIWLKLSKAGKEPRTPMKFFYGLLQMALGYFIIVWGAKAALPSLVGIATDAAIPPASLIPLVFIIGMYLFHTTGELSISPVGLSVVTKLSPAKMVGFIMGSWFLSIAFAHKIAGKLGQLIAEPGAGGDAAAALKVFADVYMNWGVYVTLSAAFLLLLLSPILKKWMHGIQ